MEEISLNKNTGTIFVPNGKRSLYKSASFTSNAGVYIYYFDNNVWYRLSGNRTNGKILFGALTSSERNSFRLSKVEKKDGK